MTTVTDTREDVEILSGLEFEPAKPTCDYTDCETEATAKLVCGICSTGVEFMCAPHAEMTAQARMEAPYERIVFDNTCKHAPFFSTCEILPI